MAQIKKVPVLRFKGFEEAWREKKLKELTTYKNGIGHEDKQRSSGKYELVNLNSISIEGGLKPSGKFINEADSTLNLNDLVMVLSDVGHGDLLGRVALIPVNNRYVLNQRVALLRPNVNVDSRYLFYNINAYQKYFKLSGAGMSQLNISKSSVENFPSFYPHLPEQNQIGNYFKELDELITLQQQKQTKLKQLKKAMLEKMFPKAGTKVPEIRFKGFIEEWEEKALTEIANIIGGGTPSTMNETFWNGDIDWYSPTEIGKSVYVYSSVKKITKSGLEKSSAIILPSKKTILFTSRAGIGDMAILMNEGATNQGFQSLVLNSNHDVYFIYSIGFKIKEYALKHSSGSTFLEISGKALGKMILQCPSLPEQQKIGAYFEELDKNIEGTQQQIEKYKHIKQALLSKMFV